jgi:hypothetical protein
MSEKEQVEEKLENKSKSERTKYTLYSWVTQSTSHGLPNIFM